MKDFKFTIGVEEEYQVIDSKTRDLKSHMSKIVDGGKIFLKEQVKEEMHQSVVEVGTTICNNVQEAKNEILHLRRQIAELADKQGLKIASAGTHPFSDWKRQKITKHDRYDEIVSEMQDTARSNLIFGMHCHVGIPSREIGLQIVNQACYFLPHLFSLSTNSPFWEGRNTGFKSFRVKIFERFPRTGLPYYYSSLAEYEYYLQILKQTKSIDNEKKIWWDLRLHPFYPTIEFRICDAIMSLDEVVALVALMQALVVKLYTLIKNNLIFKIYNRSLISENKWRASRYGIDGNLIDFGKKREVPAKKLILELLDFVDEVVDELGSRKEINYIHKILENGTGAHRQLEVYEKTKDLKKVVDYMVHQMYKDF